MLHIVLSPAHLFYFLLFSLVLPAEILAATINFSVDTILDADIGSDGAVNALAISDGVILDAATNNVNIVIKTPSNLTGRLSIANQAILKVSSGSVIANIQGKNDNVGTVHFLTNHNLMANLGSKSGSLALVNVADGVTLNTNDRNLDANLIQIGNGATLNYGNGSIVGKVEGRASRQGTFVFNRTKTANFTIGIHNQLKEINVNDGINITLGGSIAAGDINIGANSKIKVNGNSINADNISLAENSVLEISNTSMLRGAINGSVFANGKVIFFGNGAVLQNQALGANHRLEEVSVAAGTNFIVNHNVTADVIIVAGMLTQSDGGLGADDHSQIRLMADGILNYNGGIINGIIRGSSSNKGTLNINHDYSNNLAIGKSYDIANLNINRNATLSIGADISANNVNVIGTLNLGNNSRFITGNVWGIGAKATIDLGSATHNIDGNFVTLKNNTIRLTLVDSNQAGSIKVARQLIIADHNNLEISFDNNNGYISNNTTYVIAGATDGVIINKIAADKISVNNSNSNQSGLLKFTTQSTNNSLLLKVSRVSGLNITHDQNAANAYDAIDQIGSKAVNAVRLAQRYIDDPDTTNQQRELLLKSIIPQVDNGINQTAFNVAKTAIAIGENRGQNHYKFHDNLVAKFDDYNIWLQSFNITTNQNNIDAYNARSNAMIIGVDEEVSDDISLGVSFNYAQSSINSLAVNSKNTTVKSYQFNIYGGYNYEQYFIDLAIAASLNQYHSQRLVYLSNQPDTANYNGETYITKIRATVTEELIDGLRLIPELALIVARNQTGHYQETGPLALNISNNRANLIQGSIGGDLVYGALNFFSLKIEPRIKFIYDYDLVNNQQIANSSFVGQNVKFTTKAGAVDKSGIKLGFSLTIYNIEDLVLGVGYDAEYRRNYRSNLAFLHLYYGF